MIRGRTTDIWDWEGVLYRDPRYRGGGGNRQVFNRGRTTSRQKYWD